MLDTNFLDERDYQPTYEKRILNKSNNKEYYIKKIFALKSVFIISDDSRWFYESPPFLKMNGISEILYNTNYYQNQNIVAVEYMKNGKVIDAIKSNSTVLNSTIKTKIIFGVAAIMNKLHKNHIIHLDLINSIYLDDKMEPCIQISSASIVSPGTTHFNELDDNFILQNKYQFTPEMGDLLDFEISFANDVFIFGIFVYMIFTKGSYFDGKAYKVFSAYSDYIVGGGKLKTNKSIPPHYNDLIMECCEYLQYERPTFEAIIEVLKDDKYALDKDVDLDDLHEYQNRILNDSPKKSDENFFIGEEEEKNFHTNIGQIGDGETFIVYKVVDRRRNVPMCKKVVKYRNGQTTIKDAQNALKEFNVLHSIQHPCICRSLFLNLSETIDIVANGKKQQVTSIAIFLEFEEYRLIDVLNSNINNTLKTRIVVDIVHAMKFLHEKGMMHRDLKTESIMLNSLLQTKLVDFGNVKISEKVLADDFSLSGESLTKGIGSFAYMSPEMANEEEYDNKTDVYSFGAVLHRIFYGSLPKQSMKNKANGMKIEIERPVPPVSVFCAELISKCLEPDPKMRPSFKQILDLMRSKSFLLADDVDPSLIIERDNELKKFENKSVE
ncbi:hypothetical protein M9Y10_033460 [Tritrichomonas musculus]|uniref:Protein kinase domain-containing protein n=1 Tax=Tritrichomonas musculus TaxID=1915356 RepID=A0ABR2KDB0_9EUKA